MSGSMRCGRAPRLLMGWVPVLGLIAACAGGPSGASDPGSAQPARPRSAALSFERLKQGIELQQQGRHVDAVDAFEAALSEDDENGLAYLHRAESQLMLDVPAPAILAGLERAVTLLPDNPRAHHGYAEMLAQTGERQGAAKHWRRALELRPDVSDARVGLASVLEATGDLEGAQAQLEAAATLEPRSVVIRVRLATVLEQRSKFAEAGEHARIAAEISGASAPLYRRAAELLEKGDKSVEARRLRTIADRIDPPAKERKLRALKEARAKGPSRRKTKR